MEHKGGKSPYRVQLENEAMKLGISTNCSNTDLKLAIKAIKEKQYVERIKTEALNRGISIKSSSIEQIKANIKYDKEEHAQIREAKKEEYLARITEEATRMGIKIGYMDDIDTIKYAIRNAKDKAYKDELIRKGNDLGLSLGLYHGDDVDSMKRQIRTAKDKKYQEEKEIKTEQYHESLQDTAKRCGLYTDGSIEDLKERIKQHKRENPPMKKWHIPSTPSYEFSRGADAGYAANANDRAGYSPTSADLRGPDQRYMTYQDKKDFSKGYRSSRRTEYQSDY